MKKLHAVFAGAFLAVLSAFGADPIFQCEFAPGKWNADDFANVKSARWANINGFAQEKDHIVNVCPADATPQELLSPRAPETYAALVYKKPLNGNHTISARMSFDYRMAPSIVIAEKPSVSDGLHPEFRTNYEVVLFDQGLNVWRHWFENGKQVWRKVGFLSAKFEPGKVYELTVTIAFTGRGPMWTVSCDGHTFGFIDDLLMKDYYVGVIGAEGINRFYDFKIQ